MRLAIFGLYGESTVPRKEGKPMVGHMRAEAILTLRPASSLEKAIRILIRASDGAQPVRWLEFPAAAFLLLTVAGDSESGAFYLLDRKTGTWFWVDLRTISMAGTA
jgi:hypothetical protein